MRRELREQERGVVRVSNQRVAGSMLLGRLHGQLQGCLREEPEAHTLMVEISRKDAELMVAAIDVAIGCMVSVKSAADRELQQIRRRLAEEDKG